MKKKINSNYPKLRVNIFPLIFTNVEKCPAMTGALLYSHSTHSAEHKMYMYTVYSKNDYMNVFMVNIY